MLVDGGKPDRLVWPGDIIISAPSKFVSTGNLDVVKNGLDSLLIRQQSDGRLPYAGRSYPVLLSDTYHLYTLIDVYYYYMYPGELEFLEKYWNQYKLDLNYSLSEIDSSAMINVTSSNDWGRTGMGGHNIEVVQCRAVLKLSC